MTYVILKPSLFLNFIYKGVQMKIKFCFFSLLTFFFVQASIAATCTSDAEVEMAEVIKQQGSITTKDGILLTGINRVLREANNMCSGYGYYHEDQKGKMIWAKGNWRATIHHA